MKTKQIVYGEIVVKNKNLNNTIKQIKNKTIKNQRITDTREVILLSPKQ